MKLLEFGRSGELCTPGIADVADEPPRPLPCTLFWSCLPPKLSANERHQDCQSLLSRHFGYGLPSAWLGAAVRRNANLTDVSRGHLWSRISPVPCGKAPRLRPSRVIEAGLGVIPLRLSALHDLPVPARLFVTAHKFCAGSGRSALTCVNGGSGHGMAAG